ncbi:hypothetical protein O3P69_010336 [Scylla paramamosain]|uniref:Uncharacterized protein n=1 Tax=Scylla paramamosain TaxID=85552 RepID=A0AAW0TWJ4_SCYPA
MGDESAASTLGHVEALVVLVVMVVAVRSSEGLFPPTSPSRRPKSCEYRDWRGQRRRPGPRGDPLCAGRVVREWLVPQMKENWDSYITGLGEVSGGGGHGRSQVTEGGGRLDHASLPPFTPSIPRPSSSIRSSLSLALPAPPSAVWRPFTLAWVILGHFPLHSFINNFSILSPPHQLLPTTPSSSPITPHPSPSPLPFSHYTSSLPHHHIPTPPINPVPITASTGLSHLPQLPHHYSPLPHSHNRLPPCPRYCGGGEGGVSWGRGVRDAGWRGAASTPSPTRALGEGGGGGRVEGTDGWWLLVGSLSGMKEAVKEGKEGRREGGVTGLDYTSYRTREGGREGGLVETGRLCYRPPPCLATQERLSLLPPLDALFTVAFAARRVRQMRHLEKGGSLLQEASSAADTEASVRELAAALHLHLTQFTERLHHTRDRLEDTARCYHLLDKAYEWALAAMKVVGRVKGEGLASPEQVGAAARALTAHLEEHPPIPEDTFTTMTTLASRLNNHTLLQQCKMAQIRCQETCDLLRRRQAALQKAKRQMEFDCQSFVDLGEVFGGGEDVSPLAWLPCSQLNSSGRRRSVSSIGSRTREPLSRCPSVDTDDDSVFLDPPPSSTPSKAPLEPRTSLGDIKEVRESAEDLQQSSAPPRQLSCPCALHFPVRVERHQRQQFMFVQRQLGPRHHHY